MNEYKSKNPSKSKTTTTTTVTTQGPKPKRKRNRKKPVPAVQGVSQPPRNKGKLRGYLRPELETKLRESPVTALSRAVCLNAVLPYEGPQIRVRADGQEACYSIPSATTKHFLTYQMNLAAIMGTNERGASTYVPRCGKISGSSIWTDLSVGVPIVHVLDHRLLAIVPHRPSFSANPIGERWIYNASQFANPNMRNSSTIIVPPIGFPDATTTSFSRPIVGRERIFWLDFTDFVIGASPVGVTDTPYGPVHPGIDFDGRRYVWIDSGVTAEEHGSISIALLTCSLTATNTSSTTTDPLSFVIQALPEDSVYDTVTYTSPFSRSGSSYSATCVPRDSGYYCFGITGSVEMNTASLDPAILQDVLVQYHTDTQITVFSKHIINGNVVATSSILNNFFATEQVNSGALLIKNVTPSMSAGGTVHALCTQDKSPWYLITPNIASITTQASMPNLRFTGQLNKGVYGWVRNEVRGFRPCVDTVRYENGTTNSVIRSFSATRRGPFPSGRMRGMNMYWLIPPTPAAATTAVPTLLQLNFCVQFEYTTLNQTPNVSITGIDEMYLKAAMKVLQELPTFSENPLHLEGFANAISSMLSGVRSGYLRNRDGFQALFKGLSAFGGPLATMGNIATLADSLIS